MLTWLLVSEKYRKKDVCVTRQYDVRIKSEENLICRKYKALICLL